METLRREASRKKTSPGRETRLGWSDKQGICLNAAGWCSGLQGLLEKERAALKR